MKHIYKICGKVSLVCYLLMLYQLWHLCQYGGLRRHLPLLVLWTVSCGATFIAWLLARRHLRKDTPKSSKKPKIYYMEVLTFAVATVFFCGCIIYTAIPYHGALSWKLDELMHKREVTLKHDNILEDGVEGILKDLDKKLDLPEELYVSQSFQVTFDATGTVQSIDTMLYGKKKSGKAKTYLIEYDADKGDRITVWLDDYTKDYYEADMQLFPMLRILESAAWQEKVMAWSATDREQQYEIMYAGRRAFAVEDGLQYLPGDVDGDGTDAGTNCIPKLHFGGEVVGFEVSLHIPESETMTPVRYIMEPSYITPEELSEEHTAQQVEEAQEATGWIVDQNNGSMYFFLDDSHGWRLTVVDAAAGSRFYAIEKTEDGGASWEVLNENPFEGQTGVAEGLFFYNENLGVAGLSGASQTTSALYLTKDGGRTFGEIRLPMEQVTELPETAEEYGFTMEDYGYLNMPELRENRLMITVTSAEGEDDGIVFYSTDDGETWAYEGNSK